MRVALRASALLFVCVVLLLAVGGGIGARAQASDDDENQSSGVDWTDTSLTSPATRLFTPAGGALLATTTDGLMRSDDAGDTWYLIDSPDKVVYVDPTSQDVLYATSNANPLLRSADGGTTWNSLMSGPPYSGKVLDNVAVSPAAPTVIYAGLKTGSISDEYWFYRSVDAGSTWTELFHSHNSLCGWGVKILLPHPVDANRLFFSGGCHAGRDFAETLKESIDQGQTFTDIYGNRQPAIDALSGFPQALTGGDGTDPQRWYLAINRDQRFGGSFLMRSDDDGRSWYAVLDHVGGGSEDPDKSKFSVTIRAMAYDAANPATVYVARNGAYPGFPPTSVTSGVAVSGDGGQTWNDLGNQQMGSIADLALGIDGQYLFVASDRGVARLAVR
jgi:photosystem II stability/assembly factor-like uncharacterized protein